MNTFTIYPAIDLQAGRVVRLKQGDPARQTVYGDDPAGVALGWLRAGAGWLHVVNLDAAFGQPDAQNQAAIRAIVGAARPRGEVQLGGGMRSLRDIEDALTLGVSRVILGTAAAESPELVAEAVRRFGAEKICVGIDARHSRVRVRGWVQETNWTPDEFGRQLAGLGVQTVIFTNIARDGVGTGVDVAATRQLADAAGLTVIASGGVASPEDVAQVRAAGLAGVIIGRALYEGQIDLREALAC